MHMHIYMLHRTLVYLAKELAVRLINQVVIAKKRNLTVYLQCGIINAIRSLKIVSCFQISFYFCYFYNKGKN